MDNNQDNRRSFRGDFQPMVQRLLDNAPAYDARARRDDTLCVGETSRVPAVQPGAASLLHAKWQEEGWIDRLSMEERSALARAGYRIQRDEDGYFVWWREKRISHLWLHINESGWLTTAAPSIPGAKWKLVGSFSQPTVPYFDGYEVTVEGMLREALTTVLTIIREYVPENVINPEFFGVARELCDEAVQNLEIESDWISEVISSGTLSQSR